MGCCMSSRTKRDPHYAKAPTRHRSPLKPPSPEPKRSHVAITPPPASLEEETVKEVLSETPIPKPPQISPVQEPKIQPQNFTNNKRIKEEKQEEEEERTPDISQAFEICSVTDTYSTATTATTTATVTEKREDEVTSRKRVNKSPAKVPRKRPYNGERERVAKPQARREKLPTKRELSGQATTARRNVRSDRVGRDLGERSSRRSKSPATRTTAGGVLKGRARGSPANVTGKAGGRPAEVGVRSEVKKEDKSQNDNVLMQQQGNESLENPLVSLECFIFL